MTPLSAISRDIIADWRNPYYGAVPYIRAMSELESISDHYGADSAASIVAYFLANAQTWRGPVAREIKAELRAVLKEWSGR